MVAAVERGPGVLDSAGEVADTDTGTEGLVGKAAGTDIGPEGLIREVGLIHTCHRTGCSHQVADHKICTASPSMLSEIRQHTKPIMPLFFSSLLAMDTRMVRQMWRSSLLRPENVGAVLGRGYAWAGRILFGILDPSSKGSCSAETNWRND